MLQACPTYNHLATHEFLLDRYFDANADGHDPGNLRQAGAIATQVQDRIACGVLYQREDTPHFYDRLIPRQGLETTCVEEVRRYDVSEYWKELVYLNCTVRSARQNSTTRNKTANPIYGVGYYSSWLRNSSRTEFFGFFRCGRIVQH
jgi:hypothetical protein